MLSSTRSGPVWCALQINGHGASYRATARLCEAPPWLTIDWLLAAFSEPRSEAIRRYIGFRGRWEKATGAMGEIENQIFLGSDEFVASLQRALDADVSYEEIPTTQRWPLPKPLTQIAEAHGRNEAISDAYASGGYGLKEIRDDFGLHYSRVSRIVKQQRLARNKT